MNLSDVHRQLIIKAAEQVPPPWQQRYCSNVVDNLLGQANLTDEDIINTCKVIAEKMECVVNL